MDDVDFDWHSKTIEEVEQLQETSMTKGLSTVEAARRLEAYGKNELPAPAKTPLYVRLWNQLNNILIFILIGATIVSGVLQEWAEVALICAVVLINVTIGLVQEGKAEAAADAIKGMLSANAIVVRNGEQTSIPAVSTRCPLPHARLKQGLLVCVFALCFCGCCKRCVVTLCREAVAVAVWRHTILHACRNQSTLCVCIYS